MIGERMNDGWEFAKLPLDTPLADARNAAFAPVELPHDFLIWNAQALYESCDGWYRRALSPAPPPRRTVLRFDGVYMDAAVFVNGAKAYEWKYGYTAFTCDVTEFLRPGENELLVRARHQSPNSRWYSGAGIYRDVFRFEPLESAIAPDGVYVSAKREGDAWRVLVSVEHTGESAITHTVTDADGQTVATATGGAEQAITVRSPRLWSPEHPALYALTTTLEKDGIPLDTAKTAFGFRETTFDPDKGFFLNGEHIKLHGVCMHHDLGALGAAFNRAAARRQLETLKSMGVNAIRTAHNPPASDMLDLCDELGVLVIDEAFDMWEIPKTTYDYARFFPEWHARDIASFVRRDRNHPCVILWSIGNEISDTHASPRGAEIARDLKRLIETHDPRGNARVTIGSNYMQWENARACADILKIAGYNYTERLYAAHHEKHPDWAIYGSETASLVQSRGVYHFPLAEQILSDDDLQCSSLGNSGTSWGAKSLDACLADDDAAPFSLGTFLWSGFDYIGEPTPYHTRNSYFGMLDTAGFPKDAYYVLKARWTDAKTAPMIHVYPYWDWNDGQEIDVRVCTNAPRARLWLNGVLIGERDIDRKTSVHADFCVTYTPGVLRAEALDERGNALATDEQRSFGDAARLALRADRRALTADGADMAFIEISAEDEDGNPVRNANNRVRVRVTGAARFIGLDNGDSTDTDEYKGDGKRLFSGKLLCMLMAKQTAGEIVVTVSSKGLPDARLTLEARAPQASSAPHFLAENRASAVSDEIPVRKIALTCDGARTLSPERAEITVTARILPRDATYEDIAFRVMNARGIKAQNAMVVHNGCTARVTARGDGEFYLRCTANNGAQHPRVLSALRFTVEGFGTVALDPYEFVSAGLYTLSDGDVASGNERGVSVPPGREGAFGFERVDFGEDGADELTLWVFALSDDPCEIAVWDGMPNQGGERVCVCVYQKPMIWNAYQPQTFRLPCRLRGEHTLCFSTAARLHIKGFQFKRSASDR